MTNESQIGKEQLSEVEKQFYSLSPAQKFQKVLELFGTEKAREDFLYSCNMYYEERQKHSNRADVENYVPMSTKYSPPKRANFHNKIMDTLQRLSMQAKKADSLTRKILNEMSERTVAGEYVLAYIESEKDYYEDDDSVELEVKKRDNESDVSYFHRLGKGN